MAWHIYLICWHIYFDDDLHMSFSICLYTIFLGKYTGFTARGYKDCFEMIFEKTLFLPTHDFVLRPSRLLASVVGGTRGSSNDSDRPSLM